MADDRSESGLAFNTKTPQMCHACNVSFTKFSEHHEHIHSEDHHRKMRHNFRNSSRMVEHKCAVCITVVKTLPEYLNHIKSTGHLQKLNKKLNLMRANEARYFNKTQTHQKRKSATPPSRTNSPANSDSSNTKHKNKGNHRNKNSGKRSDLRNNNGKGRGGYQNNYYQSFPLDFSVPPPQLGNPIVVDYQHSQSQYSYYNQPPSLMAPGMQIPPPYYHAQHFNQELLNPHQWYSGPSPQYDDNKNDGIAGHHIYYPSFNNCKDNVKTDDKKEEPVKDLLDNGILKTTEPASSAELKSDKPVKKIKTPDNKDSPKMKPDSTKPAKTQTGRTKTSNKTSLQSTTTTKKVIKGSSKVSLTSLVSGRTSQSLKFKLDQAVKQQRKLTSSRRLKNADKSSESLSCTEELGTDAELATVEASEASEVLGQLSGVPQETLEQEPLGISPASKKQKFAATMDSTRGTVSTADYIHHVETNLNSNKQTRNFEAVPKSGVNKLVTSNAAVKQRTESLKPKTRKRSYSSGTSSSERSTKSTKKTKISKQVSTTTTPTKPSKLKSTPSKSTSEKSLKVSLEKISTQKSAVSIPSGPKTPENVQSASITSSTNAEKGDETVMDLLTLSEQEEIVRQELIVKRKDFESKITQYQEIEKQLKTLETEISTLTNQENLLRDRRLKILRKAASQQTPSTQIADQSVRTAGGMNSRLETDQRLRASSPQPNRTEIIRNIKQDMVAQCTERSVEELASYQRFYSGHDDEVTQIKVCEDELISCSKDKTIKQWEISTGKCIRTYRKHREPIVGFVIHNPSKKPFSVLYSVSTDGQICAWDLQIAEFIRSREVCCNVECVAKSERLYLGCSTGYVLSVCLPTLLIPDTGKFKISESPITSIEATSEGARKVLIVASADKNIGIYDALSGLYLRSVIHNSTYICHRMLVDSSSSRLYVVLGSVNSIDYQTGCHLNNLIINDTKITNIEITPDQDSGFAITENCLIYQFSLKTMKIINILKQTEHQGCVCTVHANSIYTGDKFGQIERAPISKDKISCKILNCELQFSSTEVLTSHVFRAHMDILLKLPTCPWSGCLQEFDDLVKLKSHIKNHAEVVGN